MDSDMPILEGCCGIGWWMQTRIWAWAPHRAFWLLIGEFFSQDSVWELVIGARQVYLLWYPGQVRGAFRILGLGCGSVGLFSVPHKPGMVMCACNASTLKMEAAEVQGYPLSFLCYIPFSTSSLRCGSQRPQDLVYGMTQGRTQPEAAADTALSLSTRPIVLVWDLV